MSELNAGDFADFFEAVHGNKPFPWQRMLVERVAEQDWPEGINLPTASGKTACIDVAIFVLALGATQGQLQADHPARRRMFFVVDRRIVVDEAYERACKLADKLEQGREGVLRKVADRLRELAGSTSPLVVSRLRGGTLRDNAWRLSPAQPAVITSTVDQVGSRLLFRSYGSGARSTSIEAGLTGCDSLILLDEAHCAVPFLQTARAVRRYAGPDWASHGEPLASTLSVSIMSATLPAEVTDMFPAPAERIAALDNELLQKRTVAPKPAELIEAKKPNKKSWTLGEPLSEDALVLDAAQRAADLAGSNRYKRIAVMVNRVATAGDINRQLRAAAAAGKIDADVALMTGRMRPLDRDGFVARWNPVLKAEPHKEPERPVILVTTQCLEVGADFSFDAMITECASLDALRQRFGRLDRFGQCAAVAAAVLVRKQDAKAEDKLKEDDPLDPIYGNALARTWNWLAENAREGYFDFGIEAVENQLPSDADRLRRMLAPSPEAPVMLPAHIDLLCQTAPQPVPDPDVALFLHGPDRGVPTAGVLFRSDLTKEEVNTWQDALTLLPPLVAETLTVPLHILRRWLAAEPLDDQLIKLSDVEGQARGEEADEYARGYPFAVWRGLRDTIVSRRPADIRPNETIAVPADGKLAERLGHAFTCPEEASLDLAECAYREARRQHVLRLVPSVLAPWLEAEPISELLEWARDEERSLEELPGLLAAVAQYHPPEGGPQVPDALRETALELTRTAPRIEPHPAGGLVLLGSQAAEGIGVLDLDTGDDDDALSAADQDVSLETHTSDVGQRANGWARRCFPAQTARIIADVARLHDLGKADPRFQVLLHGDESAAAVAVTGGTPLAKSRGTRRSRSEQIRLRRLAELPPGFRHEMLSLQLAESSGQLPDDDASRDILLHLIAGHHGHARPFAPVVQDDEQPEVDVRINGEALHMSQDQRSSLIAPHRLDSGVADRFWRLTRRFGWWQLAYLEAVFRLADRMASAEEAVGKIASAEREAIR